MQLVKQLSRLARGQQNRIGRHRVRTTTRRPTMLSLDTLEERVQPAAVVDLGAASQFGVLGLNSTAIVNDHSAVNGNVGVAPRGLLLTSFGSQISGDVTASSRLQVLGFGSVSGNVTVDPALIRQANADAIAASGAAAALAPNMTIRSIRRATTLNGNGGLNVIQINGDIEASLTLNGGANDIFVINVRGDLELGGRESLAVAGGVKAENVIYNFIGRRGRIETGSFGSIDGTVLAPRYNAQVRGAVNGEVIAGGAILNLGRGARVNQVTFVGDDGTGNGGGGSTKTASLSGFVFSDGSMDGVMDPGEVGLAGATVHLFLLDGNGNYNEVATATTDDNGAYSFTELAAGTYSVAADPYNNEFIADLIPGTVSGNQDGDANLNISVDNIVLADGDAGVNYNFGMFVLA